MPPNRRSLAEQQGPGMICTRVGGAPLPAWAVPDKKTPENKHLVERWQYTRRLWVVELSIYCEGIMAGNLVMEDLAQVAHIHSLTALSADVKSAAPRQRDLRRFCEL